MQREEAEWSERRRERGGHSARCTDVQMLDR